MILYIEPCCPGSEHTTFNAGYLTESLLEHPNKEAVFCCSVEHYTAIKGYCEDKGKSLEKIRHETVAIPKNSFFQCLVFYIMIIRKYKPEKVVSLSSDTFHFSALSIVSWLYEVEICVVIHSALEHQARELKLKDKILFFRRLPFWIRCFLRGKRNFLYVISENIKRNFFKYYYNDERVKTLELWKRVEVIGHPYIYDKYYVGKEWSSENIKIGFLGVPSTDKGFDWLSNELDNLYKNKDLKDDVFEFYLIGSGGVYLFPFEVDDKKFLPNEVFLDAINKMDYIIYPFPKESYFLRASGSMYEALNFRKPIIASDSEFISSFLSDNGVDYIRLDLNGGLEGVLEKLRNVTRDDYVHFVNCMDKFVKKQKNFSSFND
ncbi:MAG: glycosyltransferase [Gammaproteobacteria bacterium]|nr:glycosyltransferase [Gammaproteobacteria bacterium]